MDDFLENVSLLSNVDVAEGEEDTNNKVALMTAHSSKGLEFPYVFVAGMEENLFPSATMLSVKSEVEEERRLFYVAVTRAKRAVALSYAGTRMRNGKHESNAPSRFLKEIDPRFLENPLDEEDFDNTGVTHEWGGFGSRFTGGRLDRFGIQGAAGSRLAPERVRTSSSSFPQPAAAGPSHLRSHGWPRPSGATGSPAHTGTSSPESLRRQSATPVSAAAGRNRFGQPATSVRQMLADADFVGVPMTELHEGQRIEHNRFGAGTILEISGNVPDMKARIRFDAFGEKLLLLKYAKIRPLQA